MGLRQYIFTENEREVLRIWLSSGKESPYTRSLFSLIRRYKTPIREDLELMLKVINQLRSEKRWRGRIRLG